MLEDEQRRLTYYEKHQSGDSLKPKQKETRTVVIGGPIDDLINAGTRPGLMCRRKVIDLYFENDKIGKSPISTCYLTGFSHTKPTLR